MKTIKLMADYGCHPLWDMTPGSHGNIAPETLAISAELRQQLNRWARSFNETLDTKYPPNSGFLTTVAASKFMNEGSELAQQLRTELGDGYEIVYKEPL
jgi:hypothetical protein